MCSKGDSRCKDALRSQHYKMQEVKEISTRSGCFPRNVFKWQKKLDHGVVTILHSRSRHSKEEVRGTHRLLASREAINIHFFVF
ncbi:hypothetical protein Plhal304r1_c062g0150081 [Plasmopara halstedii]